MMIQNPSSPAIIVKIRNPHLPAYALAAVTTRNKAVRAMVVTHRKLSRTASNLASCTLLSPLQHHAVLRPSLCPQYKVSLGHPSQSCAGKAPSLVPHNPQPKYLPRRLADTHSQIQ